jgi:hypothetical protein
MIRSWAAAVEIVEVMTLLSQLLPKDLDKEFAEMLSQMNSAHPSTALVGAAT